KLKVAALLIDRGANKIINAWQTTINPYGYSPVVPGDVDGDGVVNSGDITLLYNFLLNGDNAGIANGDIDGDGTITAGDITLLYNILLGN
ncbi:MAG: dockerin type I repeat-containing protein, partial [Muribaculaceae bacterium]|nr:dockerin type I repeat-containing protein [Muribaculaceae bacterium]